ncbi:hypothetical protein DL98DRAFT_8518 [Cadophora sp. DSE1049]|nr:hypothetical protein DL98DRAFT_8518 [Cadophora sp. DSE1049]
MREYVMADFQRRDERMQEKKIERVTAPSVGGRFEVARRSMGEGKLGRENEENGCVMRCSGPSKIELGSSQQLQAREREGTTGKGGRRPKRGRQPSSASNMKWTKPKLTNLSSIEIEKSESGVTCSFVVKSNSFGGHSRRMFSKPTPDESNASFISWQYRIEASKGRTLNYEQLPLGVLLACWPLLMSSEEYHTKGSSSSSAGASLVLLLQLNLDFGP